MFQVNFLPNRNDFSNRFSCFSFQKQRKQRWKKNCLLMVKRNQNTIGLDLVVETGGEKKTTTRSNQKCKCATISKCAQNAFNGYKNRQRLRQRHGQALRGHREQRDTNLVRLDIFKTAKVSGELSALVCCRGAQMPWQSRFLICTGKLCAPSPPLFATPLTTPYGAWLQQHRQRQTMRGSGRGSARTLHPHLRYKCDPIGSHWCRGHLFYILDKLIIITLSISLHHSAWVCVLCVCVWVHSPKCNKFYG